MNRATKIKSIRISQDLACTIADKIAGFKARP